MMAHHSLYERLAAEAAADPELLHPHTLNAVGAAVTDLASRGRAGGLVFARTPGHGTAVAVIADQDRAGSEALVWPPDAADEWFVVVAGVDLPLAICGKAAEDEDDGIDTVCSTEPRIAELAAQLLLDALAPQLEDPPVVPRAAPSPQGLCDTLVSLLLRRMDDAERRAQEASAQVIHAVERDRTRSARLLHDGPVQELTAALLFLDGATQTDAIDRDLLDRGRQTLAAATVSCRYIMDRLAPAMTDPGELRMRIERWLPRVADPAAVDVVVDLPATLERTHQGLLLDVVRCVDKLVDNVVRHAGGRLAAVRVLTVDHVIVIEVADFGAGGAPAVPVPGASGLGLLTRRVHNRRGTLTVQSAHSGTTVTVRLPIPAG